MKPKAMRRAYLREAMLTLILARLAVRVLPSAKIFAWANRPLRRIRRFATDEAHWTAWAVETMARKSRMEALYLPRALAVHAMLRRRGIASRLCLGVADNQGALLTHAWIEVGQDVIAGGADVSRFARLT